jgi:hypothetical protein
MNPSLKAVQLLIGMCVLGKCIWFRKVTIFFLRRGAAYMIEENACG